MAAPGNINDADIHKVRLLQVEERPYKRVAKHFLNVEQIAYNVAGIRQSLTPPPEPNGINGDHDAKSPTTLNNDDDAALETVKLDSNAFISSVDRLWHVLTANEEQRDKYTSERVRISDKLQNVRGANGELKSRLEEARAAQDQRKKFDELADRIERNPNLRSRSDQATQLAKLQDEIKQLKAESMTYGATWRERRDQFARIMDESMRLRRQIRDEKEEVERREGMDEEDHNEGAAGDVEGGQTPRPGTISGNGTPRPDSGLLSKGGPENSDAAGTPRPLSTLGGMTPARESPAPGGESQSSLKPRPSALGALSPGISRAGSQAPSQAPSRASSRAPSPIGSRIASREPSPARPEQSERGETETGGPEDGEDIDMQDNKGAEDTEMQDTTEDVDAGEINEEEGKEEEMVDTVDTPDSPLTPLPSDDAPLITVDGSDGGGDGGDDNGPLSESQ